MIACIMLVLKPLIHRWHLDSAMSAELGIHGLTCVKCEKCRDFGNQSIQHKSVVSDTEGFSGSGQDPLSTPRRDAGVGG